MRPVHAFGSIRRPTGVLLCSFRESRLQPVLVRHPHELLEYSCRHKATLRNPCTVLLLGAPCSSGMRGIRSWLLRSPTAKKASNNHEEYEQYENGVSDRKECSAQCHVMEPHGCHSECPSRQSAAPIFKRPAQVRNSRCCYFRPRQPYLVFCAAGAAFAIRSPEAGSTGLGGSGL